MTVGGFSAAVFQTAGSFEHDAAKAAPSTDPQETVLAFDFGTRRIGVAIGNTRLRIAHPLTTISAEDNRTRMHAIAALVEQWQPTRLVLGYPVSSGDGQHALMPSLQRFERRLKARFGLPVERMDETLSSWDASRRLTAGGVPARRQRTHIDAAAAGVILQSWFESLGAQAPRNGPCP